MIFLLILYWLVENKLSKYKVTAIIPAFNEEEKIEEVIKKTKKYVDEVIVIDDCSIDATKARAIATGVSLISLPKNMGVGYATRVGCELALQKGAHFLVTLDSDGQHDPADIPAMLDMIINKNLDIVFGYREKDHSMPFIKKIGNSILAYFSQILYGIRLKDALTGFHVFKACSFPQITWESNRYGFIQEFVLNIYKNKLSYGEVLVKTIYLDKKVGMRKRDGLKSIYLLFYWKGILLLRKIKSNHCKR